MFSIFRRKSPAAPDLSAIGTDMHSHLLPGIDDGSPDPATSLELLRGLQELGFRKFITTPHVLWDLYPNTDSSIEAAMGSLSQASGAAVLPLHAAAEYMLDDHFAEMVRKREPLRTLREKYVLVEFSFVALPYQWKELVFELQMANYYPVLAHPERYGFLAAQPSIFREMADMGVVLQINLLSLTGYYGKQPQQTAQWLLKQGLVSFVGTDLHHHRHLQALRMAGNLISQLDPLVQSGKLLNHLL